jgi:hypothetical protein
MNEKNVEVAVKGARIRIQFVGSGSNSLDPDLEGSLQRRQDVGQSRPIRQPQLESKRASEPVTGTTGEADTAAVADDGAAAARAVEPATDHTIENTSGP